MLLLTFYNLNLGTEVSYKSKYIMDQVTALWNQSVLL